MSTLKASLERIVELSPHPNADRLEIATVLGWQCVVQKGRYKVGQLALYIPIDSVLPETLEGFIFGPDAKVKLNNHRVKTIKLRGAISQGLVVDMNVLNQLPNGTSFELGEGTDLTAALGITKYEPPLPGFQSFNRVSKRKKVENPNFHKYTSIENIKNYNKVFQPEDDVEITEKIHGTNFRAGWVPFEANTLLKKIKKFLRLAPSHEFVFGSHNVQLDLDILKKPDENVYAWAVDVHNLQDRLQKGEVVYGEIYGPKIQKGYAYGKKDAEKGLVVFDIEKDGKFLDNYEFHCLLEELDLQMPPILFKGKFKDADVAKLVDGDSLLDSSQKTREGAVIKPLLEVKAYCGRKVLKAINPEYLLKDQTDFH